ncbi:hypothetical protein N0V83_000084 [Neocucurbitaria cava]|uniref:NACHT domain-containing protein n=1 Tax=Neocucurbitaria cava TaxID=798079 RepID=A0A9W8YH37_9PLEO|nr:hypothetical protein N0V83_000084 [Neocucurbitaria cava]
MTSVSAGARLTLQDAFERFAATVNSDDKRLFNSTNFGDVRDEAIKIERQLRARRTQRNMARLEPFLKGVNHYSSVVEALCDEATYLSWLWGPVKLMLMITVDSLGAFEKLIDAYGKIAENLPCLIRSAAALSNNHSVQNVVVLVYSDLLEFHSCVYKLVCRRAWATFFDPMWADFEPRFHNILRRLACHRDLLDRKATAGEISTAVEQNVQEVENWKHQEVEWRARKAGAVLTWLKADSASPQDTLAKHNEGTLAKHNEDCLPGTCDWFIKHTDTQSWLKDRAQKSLFWVYGKPGAGKSVICAALVHHAKANAANVFYFFCSFLDRETKNSSHVLRSLASQIIQEHHDLAIYVHDVYYQSPQVPSKKSQLALLQDLMRSLGSVRFIIDGLDEWNPSDQKELLRDLTQLLSTDPSTCICKVLVASRETLETVRGPRKGNKGVVRMSISDGSEGLAVNASIEKFIDNKLLELPEHIEDLDPDSTIMSHVKQTLIDKHHGTMALSFTSLAVH